MYYKSLSTDSPSSAKLIEEALLSNGYCTKYWDEKIEGMPTIGDLESYHAVVWSAGDYFNSVIDENETEILRNFTGGIIFEGSDIAFDHANDSFMTDVLGGMLDADVILGGQEQLLLGQHEILNGIAGISVNASLAPFPDSITPLQSTPIASWNNASAAITALDKNNLRALHIAFSIDGIQDQNVRDRLLLNSVEWAGAVTRKSEISLYPGFNLASIPVRPANNLLPGVLSSLAGRYNVIYSYNSSNTHWDSFNINKPSFLNTLKRIDIWTGFWINVSGNATLQINGTVVMPYNVTLKKGWNMIGYSSIFPSDIIAATEGVRETFDLIWEFDASDIGNEWKSYSTRNPPLPNTLIRFEPGRAYWVNATNDTIWILTGNTFNLE